LKEEIRNLKEEIKSSYSKDLEIKHLNAQLKSKDLEIDALNKKYHKKLKKREKETNKIEENWKSQYDDLYKEIQSLRLENTSMKREKSNFNLDV